MENAAGMFGMALLLAAALPAGTPLAAGHWEGYFQRGTAQLQVSLDFPASDASKGQFSAPALGAIDIPLSNVHQGEHMQWALVGDAFATTFEGTLSGDTMTGTFSEPRGNGTYVLHRLSTSTEKPYTQEDVTFSNGNVRLAGTVYAPRAPGKHPAVIFVHGSGAEGRWASAYLGDYVARHGIVALAYDKRGVGASTGDWRSSTMEDLVADARVGVDLLARRADVDPGKIGVYGHSQGGVLAPAIGANNASVNWIIAADYAVGPQYLQDLYRVDTLLATKYSGQDLTDAKALYAEFVDVARGAAAHDKLRADMRKAASAAWLDDLGIPGDDSWIWSWYPRIANYDDTASWGAIRVPVLLLFGADDALDPVQESVAQAVAILRAHGNSDVTVRVLPGADHTLRIPPSAPGAWPQLAAGFPDIIVSFANGRLH
jgi:pimeloyl-ACP methyl ester carboxylesterase